ncbi:MAG: hypothetical protein KAH23_10260 [Kiritimatiellae bacterium]|nr:hypothetical protein [Kiritimatiellia bacterium]
MPSCYKTTEELDVALINAHLSLDSLKETFSCDLIPFSNYYYEFIYLSNHSLLAITLLSHNFISGYKNLDADKKNDNDIIYEYHSAVSVYKEAKEILDKRAAVEAFLVKDLPENIDLPREQFLLVDLDDEDLHEGTSKAGSDIIESPPRLNEPENKTKPILSKLPEPPEKERWYNSDSFLALTVLSILFLSIWSFLRLISISRIGAVYFLIFIGLWVYGVYFGTVKRKFTILAIIAFAILVSILATPQSRRGGVSGAIARDGWISHSTGSGTASHHGGVEKWLYHTVPMDSFDYCYWYLILIIYPGISIVHISSCIKSKISEPKDIEFCMRLPPEEWRALCAWWPKGTVHYGAKAISCRHMAEALESENGKPSASLAKECKGIWKYAEKYGWQSTTPEN